LQKGPAEALVTVGLDARVVGGEDIDVGRLANDDAVTTTVATASKHLDVARLANWIRSRTT